MMRDQLVVQERMDTCLDSMSEEICQICSQSQENGAKMAAIVELEADHWSYRSPAIAHK